MRRKAAATVEAALVFPALLTLLIGVIVGGVGVFNYQQTMCLAQEAARYACVRGSEYERDLDRTAPTVAEIRTEAVLPRSVTMDTSALKLQAWWVDNGVGGTAQDWDAAPKDVKSLNAAGEYVSNNVRVTVTYLWSPGFFLPPLTLSATVEVAMES